MHRQNRLKQKFNIFFILVVLCIAGIKVEAGDPPVKLILGGDVMLSNWVMEQMDQEGLDYPFLGVRDILQMGDIRFCNLEVPIGIRDDSSRFEKTYTFALPPRYRESLTHGGFDVVSMANNHMLDYSAALADSTVQYLDSLGIKHIGYGKNTITAPGPVVIDKKLKVGFLGYSMTFPREFWATRTRAGTAYPDKSNFAHPIKELENEVDFTVVSFHWGAENSDSTKKYQQEFARKAIDLGADLVIGHHPHIWQGLETYKNRLIAYSLGNFCFGSFSPTATESGLLEVDAGPDTIYSAKIHPLNVKNVEVRFQPKLMDSTKAIDFFRKLRFYSSRFDSTSTTSISDDGIIQW